jgi:FSR family fosmidomycin resistance protein-like MFS transporter
METNSYKNRKAIMWLSGGHFINDVYTGVLNPIMPFIAVKLGFSMAVAIIILSTSHIFSSLLQPLFGFFADKMSKYKFVFWGLLLNSIFIPLSPTFHKISLLIIFIIISSIGSSLFHPQALGLTTDFTSKNNDAKAMSMFIAMGTLGYSFGPIVSSWITQYLGFEKMPLMSIVGITWAILFFKFVPKTTFLPKTQVNINFKTAFKAILKNKKLNILNLIAMLKTMVTSSCFILLPFLWKSMGHKPIYIGTALFLFIFAGGIGSFISDFMEKKLGSANVFYISMILPLPLMILFLKYCQYEFSLLIFIAIGMIAMMASPVTMVMAQKVLPEYKSIISGFINGFSWGVVAIILSGLSYVAQAIGIIPILIVIAIIPAICSIFVKELFKD